MKKVFVVAVVCCFMCLCVSCQNNKVKFNAFEEKSYLLGLENEIKNEIRFEGGELKIYKNYREMISDFDNKKIVITNDTFFEKYDDDFFNNKSLVLLYVVDPYSGIKYTFKSINITDNELVLNIKTSQKGEHLYALTPRLFIIEIDQKNIKAFDKLKCKFNEKK